MARNKVVFLFMLMLVCAAFATDAIAAYRSNTGTNGLNSPKIRIWNSTTNAWGSEVELPTAGSPIRYITMKTSPLSGKTVIVTQSDDGYLDAYACISNCGSAGSWTVSNNVGRVWASAPGTSSRRYDFDFEQAAGDAVLVYGVVNANKARDLAYRVLPAASAAWGAEQYIDDTGHSTDLQYSWVEVDAKPRSDEMIMSGFDSTDNHINAWVWDGASWGNQLSLSTTATATGGYEAMATRYSADGSDGMVIGAAGTTGNMAWAYWNGASWSGISTWDISLADSNDARSVIMKADPSSAALQAVIVDSASHLHTSYWSGSAWTVTSNIDTAIDSSTTRPAGFDWMPTGSTGRLVWDTDTGGTTLSQRACSPRCTGSTSTFSAYAGAGAWLAMRTNPSTTDAAGILGFRLNSAFGIGSFGFDGTTYTNYGDTALTSSATVSTYEAFDSAFYKPRPVSVNVTLNSPADGSIFSSPSITLNWTPSGFASSPVCNATRNGIKVFSGTCANNAACTTTNSTADGTYSWNVTCAAGPSSNTSQSWSFTVDTVAPATAASAMDDSGSPYPFNVWTNSSYVNVSLSCADSGSGCATTLYCNDTSNSCAPNSAYSGPVKISTQGVSYFRFRSNDTAGNLENTKIQGMGLDGIPPTTGAAGAKNDSSAYTFGTWTGSSYVNVTLSCGDPAGSGCDTTLYCTDLLGTCQPAAQYSSPVQVSSEGLSYILFSSNDTAGNRENVQNRTIMMDRSPPLIDYTSQSEADGASLARNWAYFEISYSEPNPANCTLNLSGSIYPMQMNSTNCYLNATGLPDGNYAYSIAMNDSFGNSNSTAGRSLSISTLAPLISFVEPTDANDSASSRNWTYVNASASGAGILSSFVDFNRSLLAYWSFDNVSGDTVFDSSTYGNDGTSGVDLKNSSEVSEGGTATVSCAQGTISSYTSFYATNCNATACGSCTLGSTGCSVTFNNANCGDPCFGTVKTGELNISCSAPGAALSQVSGKFGRALAFNGSATSVSATSQPAAADNFTIEFWANPSAGTVAITSEANSGISGTSGQRYAVFPSQGDAAYGAGHAGAGVSVGTNAIIVFEHAANYMPSPLVYPVSLSGWNHIAVVYTNKQPTLYLNGIQVRTGLASSKTVHPSLNAGGGSYGYFNGSVDEFRVWNRALSPQEISASYGASAHAENNFTGLPDGNYSFYGYAIDAAGTANRTETRDIILDTLPPASVPSAVDNESAIYAFGTETMSPYVNVTISCSDSGSGCNRTLYCTDALDNCTPSAPYSGIVQVSSQGTSFVRYLSFDRANNSEAAQSRTIKIVVGSLLGSCGTISSANSLNFLSADMSSSGDCLVIDAPNVTLDCKAHTITGDGSPLNNSAGIVLSGASATVRNCNVMQFGSGMEIYYSGSNSITGLNASNNTIGILIQGSTSNTLDNVAAWGNAEAIHVQYSSSNSLSNILAFNNNYSIYEDTGSTGNSKANIIAYNNTYG